MSLVNLLTDISLELESWRQNVVLHAEWIDGHVDVLRLLQAVEITLGSKRVHLVKDGLLEVSILVRNDLLIILAVGLRPPTESLRVDNDDGHAAVLKRVTVQHDLGDILGLDQDILDLLRGDILALRQLKDTLASVENLDGAVRVDDTHVAGVQVAIFVDGLGSLVGSEEVAACDARATHTNLTAWERLVINPVVHLRQVLETDGSVHHWPANSARNWVVHESERHSAAGL